MYDLFTQAANGSRLSTSSAIHTRALKLMQDDIARIKTYYAKSNIQVNNEHVLCKLIQSITVSRGKEPQVYVDHVSDVADRVTGSLRFTNSVSFGNILDNGYFYNRNVLEVLITGSDYVDITQLSTDWTTWEPVRVLSHPFSDLSMALPTGRYVGKARGMAYIYVDVPLLMLMHRQWLKSLDAESKVVDGTFVHNYVLPGMVKSHVNCAFVNRFLCEFTGTPTEGYYRAHPFTVADITRDYDQGVVQSEAFLKSGPSYQTILSNLQGVGGSWYDNAILPEMPPTQQVQWALIGSRLNLMELLLLMHGKSPNTANIWHNQHLVTRIETLENDQSLTKMLTQESAAQVVRIKGLLT